MFSKYYMVVSWNGFRWLFPKDGSGFMTIKELEDICRGIVPKKWRKKRGEIMGHIGTFRRRMEMSQTKQGKVSIRKLKNLFKPKTKKKDSA